MSTKVSATVPPNPINDLILKLQERENLIFQKILEIEALRKRTFIFLFFSLLIVFFLLFLNIYFILRWQRKLSFSKEKEGEKLSRKSPKDLDEKIPLLIFCQTKDCLFYRKNGCQLKEFGKKLVDFSQFFSSKDNLLNEKLKKVGEEISQNCYFNQKEMLILKKKLKRIRYLLNKIKKEKNSFYKKEAEKLWNFAHKITLAIVKFQAILVK